MNVIVATFNHIEHPEHGCCCHPRNTDNDQPSQPQCTQCVGCGGVVICVDVSLCITPERSSLRGHCAACVRRTMFNAWPACNTHTHAIVQRECQLDLFVRCLFAALDYTFHTDRPTDRPEEYAIAIFVVGQFCVFLQFFLIFSAYRMSYDEYTVAACWPSCRGAIFS